MSSATNTLTNDTTGDPGLSLWLVPPKDSEVYGILSTVISRIVPAILDCSQPLPQFEPHVTLTSRISRDSIGADPQQWLDGIELPQKPTVEVRFDEVATGNTFTKKLFIRCTRSESLLALASSCRGFSSANVGEAQYDPHVSLLYSDDEVSEESKWLVERELANNNLSASNEACNRWEGGSIWLVPTDGDVADWRPIATRNLG